MVPLKSHIEINPNKLFEFILPKAKKSANEKNIFYIRLYTDLIRAEDSISKEKHKRMMNFLKIVRNMTRNPPIKGEDVYLKRIHSIANGILNNIRCTKCKATDCNVCNPAHAKTKLQLAQNICILRMLKGES